MEPKAKKSDLWAGISKDRQAKIRKAVEDEVRSQLETRMTKELRARLEKEQWEEQPSTAELERFREFLDDIEADCMAQAHLASEKADTAESKLKWSQRLLNPLNGVTAVGLIPFAYSIFVLYGRSLQTAAYAVTAALAALVLGVTTLLRHSNLNNKRSKARRLSSDFMEVATSARTTRTVGVLTRAGLTTEARRLIVARQDCEKRFAPRISDFQRVRDVMKQRIAVEAESAEIESLEAEAASKPVRN